MNNDNKQSSNFIPLRLLDVFTSIDFYAKNCRKQNVTKLVKSIWNYVIKNNYFMRMRKIIETKIPSPYDEQSVPYTPLERSIYELTIRPLNIDYDLNEERLFIKQIVIQFFKQFLNGPFSPIIRFHIFKMINEELPKLFEFKILASVLLDNGYENNQRQAMILPKNVWTLFALLSICTDQIEHASFNEKLVYLFYIKNLISYLPNQCKSNEQNDSDDDEDGEAMDTNNISNSDQVINQIANDSIKLLNSLPNVNCFNNLTKSLNESHLEELLSLSIMGYSILINNNKNKRV